MVFHWSPIDSKNPQVSRTILSILADFESTVIPSSVSLFSKLLVTFQVHLLQLVPPSGLCSTAFSALW